MIAALLLLAVSAADAPPVWQGVWDGTVGTLPVRVCLARRSPIYSVGSYYYRTRLRTIKLDQQNGSRDWLEGEGISNGPPRPRWRFETVARGLLAGSWSGDGRTLPFRLTPVAVARGTEPCGSGAFNAPRVRRLRVATARASKDGVGYTKIVFDPGPAFAEIELETFALDGVTPATRRINARLRRAMGTGAAPKADWYQCVASGLDAQGTDGDYHAAVEPELITPRWLAAAESIGGYCGGAHPYGETISLTFDRATGADVDLHGWLTPAAIERRLLSGSERVAVLRPVLRRLIVAQARDLDPECRTPMLEAEFWDIGLARTGLRFRPSLAHVEQGCEEQVLVPWRALASYLSARGRAGRATLQ